jgi:hypothetical protein
MEERNGLYYIKNAILLPPPKPTVKGMNTIEPIDEYNPEDTQVDQAHPDAHVPITVDTAADKEGIKAVPTPPAADKEGIKAVPTPPASPEQIKVETVEDGDTNKDTPSSVSRDTYLCTHTVFMEPTDPSLPPTDPPTPPPLPTPPRMNQPSQPPTDTATVPAPPTTTTPAPHTTSQH